MYKSLIVYFFTLINLLMQNSEAIDHSKGVDYYDAQGSYRRGTHRSPFSEEALSESLYDQTEEESGDSPFGMYESSVQPKGGRRPSRGVAPQSSRVQTSLPTVERKLQLTDGNAFYKSAVGNQLQLGTCATFAVVDGLLFAHNTTLSPAYLNVTAKKVYAKDCKNDGLNLQIAMTTAYEIGTVMDWIWPYVGYYAEVKTANKAISNKPQPNWDVCIKSPYSEAEDKGLVKFGFKTIIDLLQGSRQSKAGLIRNALLTYECPVIISVPVKENEEWRNTARIRTLLKAKEIKGWHAISLCGFNDKIQEFTFKNSWGLGWGNQGFGTMSYTYIMEHCTDAWVGFGMALKA